MLRLEALSEKLESHVGTITRELDGLIKSFADSLYS